ncbi:MAG: hypothetical protein AAB198_01845 [Actinomycetota bacterium]
MSRRLALAIAATLVIAACGDSGGATPDTSPERFCAWLSQANNNDAFINLHNQYFTDWPELTGLIDGLEESAPTEMAATVATFAGLVDQVAATDHTGATGDPTQVLDAAATAELEAAEAVLDAYAASTCGFALRH